MAVSELEKLVSEFFEQSLSQVIPTRGSLILNIDGNELSGEDVIPGFKLKVVELFS